MSVDAVAILPPIPIAPSSTVEGDWKQGSVAGGGQILWRELSDGILVNLGVPFAFADADIYAAAQSSFAELPSRIWVFPDSAVPEADTVSAVQAATRLAGRWVRGGKRKKTLLEDFGLSRAEAAAWQREINSKDKARIAAAMETLAQRLGGRDDAEVQALIDASLRR
jgi:hypothetical protein